MSSLLTKQNDNDRLWRDVARVSKGNSSSCRGGIGALGIRKFVYFSPYSTSASSTLPEMLAAANDLSPSP